MSGHTHSIFGCKACAEVDIELARLRTRIAVLRREFIHLRARIAELEEEDRQRDKHSVVQIVEQRNRLAARDEMAKEMAEWIRGHGQYTAGDWIVKAWEEAGKNV